MLAAECARVPAARSVPLGHISIVFCSALRGTSNAVGLVEAVSDKASSPFLLFILQQYHRREGLARRQQKGRTL
jgi:hypothetical protein